MVIPSVITSTDANNIMKLWRMISQHCGLISYKCKYPAEGLFLSLDIHDEPIYHVFMCLFCTLDRKFIFNIVPHCPSMRYTRVYFHEAIILQLVITKLILKSDMQSFNRKSSIFSPFIIERCGSLCIKANQGLITCQEIRNVQ